MKPTIDYSASEMQMGDLINSMGVSIRNDFSDNERAAICKRLKKYLYGSCNKPLKVDLKKFVLSIIGADEAGHLIQYFI